MSFSSQLPYPWLSGNGPASDIALSSRLRIARNLADQPFPHRMNEIARRELVGRIEQAMKSEPPLQRFRVTPLESLEQLDREILVENQIISVYQIQDPRGRGVLEEPESPISAMINEEDHLRLQCLLSGLDLEKGWAMLSEVDDALEGKLPFAFHEQWGYLAACPTNLGTGLRASVLLHLPALTFLQAMPNLIHSLNQKGLVVRGFYGEGTESQGHFYQLSNAFSLGPKEEDIVSRVSYVARQVLDQEVQGRERIKTEQSLLLEDRVWRALAALKSARIVNSAEAMENLSMVRLGVQLKILPGIPIQLLNELLFMTRPANIQKYSGGTVDAAKRDSLRAELLRGALEKY